MFHGKIFQPIPSLQKLMCQVCLIRLVRLPNQTLPVPQQRHRRDVVAAAQQEFPSAAHDQTSLGNQNWEDSPRLSLEKWKVGVVGFFFGRRIKGGTQIKTIGIRNLFKKWVESIHLGSLRFGNGH